MTIPKHIYSNTVVSLFLIFGLSAMFACRESKKPAEPSSTKVRVMLPWSISPEFAFLFNDTTPESQSISLNPEFEPSKGSSEVVQAFDLGKADFGFLSGDSLMLARQKKNIPIKALFVLYQRSPSVIVALKGTGIRHPKDILHRRVGVIKASTTFPQFLGMMKNAGYPVLSEGDNKNITLDDAINGGVLQLKTKQIDALTSFSNFAPVQLVTSGDEIEPPIEFSKFGIEIYGTVFAASEGVINREPQLVQQVVTLLLSRIRAMVSKPEVTKAKFVERPDALNTDPDLVSMSIQATVSLIAPDGNVDHVGAMSADGWAKTNATLVKTGQASSMEPTSCFDDRFYREAIQVLSKSVAQ